MPSGGHGSSGPLPSPSSVRANLEKGDWTRLPAAGRTGDPPEWPLANTRGRGHAREKELWEREWRRPQAIMWERLGLVTEVAIYVRTLAAAERPISVPKNIVPLRTLLRQQQDALGLSVPGLARNRWLIVEEANAERRSNATSNARDRYKVLEGGAATG